MGQDAHRKYKEYKNAEKKLKPWSSSEERLEVQNKKLQYEIQEIKDDQEFKRTNDMFDMFNGRD